MVLAAFGQSQSSPACSLKAQTLQVAAVWPCQEVQMLRLTITNGQIVGGDDTVDVIAQLPHEMVNGSSENLQGIVSNGSVAFFDRALTPLVS